MTRADDVGDWRDLADQLTPEQVAELVSTEQAWERMAQSRSRYVRNASTSGTIIGASCCRWRALGQTRTA